MFSLFDVPHITLLRRHFLVFSRHFEISKTCKVDVMYLIQNLSE